MTRPMRFRIGQRDRRALAIGAFLIVPVLGWRMIVRPYADALTKTRDQLVVQRRLLARELELLASANRYPAELSRAERALNGVAPRLFTGPDDVTATAALAYYVSDQVRKARLVIQQVETHNAEPAADGVIRLDMTVRAEGDLEGIVTLLRRLESGPKLVRVEQITVEASAGQTLGAMPEAESEALSFAATFRGYAPARADSADATTRAKAARIDQRGSE